MMVFLCSDQLIAVMKMDRYLSSMFQDKAFCNHKNRKVWFEAPNTFPRICLKSVTTFVIAFLNCI